MFTRYRIQKLIILPCILLIILAFSPLRAKNVSLHYTKAFHIEYLENGVKKITDGASRQILLVPRGKKIPMEYKSLPVIYTPINRVLYASVTQVCFLRPFNDPGIWKSIIGVTSPSEEWYLNEVKSGLQNGRITFVGDSFKPNFELIQSIRPELVFVYTGPTGQYGLIKMLEELKIPYVVDNDYLETNPLGRLEWLKFIAAFYNKDIEADSYIKKIAQRVKRLHNKLRPLKKPKIAWGMIYNGKAFVPGNQSFAAQMITLAGGDNVFADSVNGVSSIEVSMEQFYMKAREADIFIYAVFPAFASSLNAIQVETPLLGEIKAFRSQKVWCLQPWYNQLLDKTDEIIFDLAHIFHPDLNNQYRVKHFKKIP